MGTFVYPIPIYPSLNSMDVGLVIQVLMDTEVEGSAFVRAVFNKTMAIEESEVELDAQLIFTWLGTAVAILYAFQYVRGGKKSKEVTDKYSGQIENDTGARVDYIVGQPGYSPRKSGNTK